VLLFLLVLAIWSTAYFFKALLKNTKE